MVHFHAKNIGTLNTFKNFENGKENFDWRGSQTRNLWITVPALSHLSYMYSVFNTSDGRSPKYSTSLCLSGGTNHLSIEH